SPAPARVIDASGNRLNNAPEIKGLLSANYGLPLGNGSKLDFSGSVSYTYYIFYNAANDPVARKMAYTVVDARGGWTRASGRLDVALFGKNLFDEEYFHNIVQFTSTSLPPPAATLPAPGQIVTDPLSVGHALGYPAPGRQWGLEFTYRFGD
ncbi:MAG: TonB-dependent receptor, partial [Steroidobacteraceae bacterium]|nr:TonB-dependent receptor [Steroidobacteraceae bacterium]MDW8260537.1 TonB-dependent receptor [Gammaproteobacteria bacterium]